jgi:hypothetical protein
MLVKNFNNIGNEIIEILNCCVAFATKYLIKSKSIPALLFLVQGSLMMTVTQEVSLKHHRSTLALLPLVQEF